MRSPSRKRPRKDDQLVPGVGVDLAGLANEVSYIISTEHKDYLTTAGPGNLRSDATACPRDIDRLQAETWLKEAVGAGHVSAACDGNFPRYAWKQVGERVFEARLSNAGLGQYKGYPLEPHEAPGWLA